MSILSLHNVSQSFGAFTVFSGATANVPHGAKIGIVGPNGIGKTSLLLIIAGLSSGGGTVSRAQGVRLGYLRQEAMDAFAARTNTVYEEMLTVFEPLKAMEERLREYEEGMAQGGASPETLHDYGTLMEQYQHAGGYDYDLRIEQTLQGLGFSTRHYDLPLSHLSGGQKTRALLARLLLERPDLLILDEPTNHLDVEAVEWLEGALKLWDGALLVVSHDRYFLDTVVTTIWEMTREGITAYRGNYSAYLQQRQDRWEWAERVFEEERERMAKELDYIKRNIDRDATNAQAVGRLRRLSRDLSAIEEIGIVAYREAKSWVQTGLSSPRLMGVEEAERALKGLRSPNVRPPRLNLRLKAPHRSGDLVLRTRDLQVGYPGTPLFAADDITLTRGEVAALIGQNGTGKTTFLRTVMGQLEALHGRAILGASLKVGYFAQVHDRLNPDNTVLEELTRHRYMLTSEARNYLAAYLFRGDDVFKKVGALSGGERARLALAILALEGANFLLLDEPTNHLDIGAQEVLQEVFEAFEGTILMVTHDRYLVDHLATQIWELNDGHLRVFAGEYQAFLAEREQARRAKSAQAAVARASSGMEYHAPGRSKNELRRQREALNALEGQIAQVETALRRIERGLETASAQGRTADIERLGRDYASTRSQLDALMRDWETLAAEAEAAS